jgi:hypothetical protein
MPVSQDCLLRLVGYAFFGFVAAARDRANPQPSHSWSPELWVRWRAGMRSRHAEIASLTGFTVAAFCVIVWILQLSVLVKLISDSILIGLRPEPD